MYYQLKHERGKHDCKTQKPNQEHELPKTKQQGNKG